MRRATTSDGPPPQKCTTSVITLLGNDCAWAPPGSIINAAMSPNDRNIMVLSPKYLLVFHSISYLYISIQEMWGCAVQFTALRDTEPPTERLHVGCFRRFSSGAIRDLIRRESNFLDLAQAYVASA